MFCFRGYLSAKKGAECLLKVYKRIAKYMYKASLGKPCVFEDV